MKRTILRKRLPIISRNYFDMTTQTLQKWNKVKLGDVAEIESGGTPSSAKSEYWDGGNICWATLPDLKNKYLFDTQRKITPLGLKNSSAKLLPVNSVIFSSRATIGEVSIAKVETSTNQGSKNFICDPTKIDYEFLYYLLKSKVEEINNLASGATYKEINKTVFSGVEVEIPSIPAQKQIAQILAVYDDLIYNNTRRIQILEQMAQAVYSEWFGEPASSWKIVSLRDVIKSYIGGGWGKEEPDKKYSGSAYVIRGTDIPKASVGDVSTCPLRYHTPSNLKTRVLQDGDLVFEVSGGSKGQPVGRSLLVTSKFLDQFNQNIICASFCKLIRPDQDKISPFQLYEQILSWYANGIIEKYQVQSTGISNFRFESFIDEEKVALPPQEVRDKFDDMVSPLFDEIYSLGNRNQNLRQTRDLLLPKLVTGEIQV